MKKYLFFIALLAVINAFAQSVVTGVPIAGLPLRIGKPTNAWLPISYNGITYRIDINDLMSGKLDTAFVRNDSFCTSKNGVTKCVPLPAGSGTGDGGTTNIYNNGKVTFTDTVTYIADGALTTIKLFTGGKTVTRIRIIGTDHNGDSYLPTSGSTRDTTHIDYGVAPTGTIVYELYGELQPLPAPGLSATAASLTSIQLAWGNVNGARVYDVQYSYDSVNWGSKGLFPADVHSYLDTGLVQNQRYYYRVRGLADSITFLDGNFSYASALTAALAKIAMPSLTASAISSDSVQLSWTNVANETGYLLQAGNDSVTFIGLDTLPANSTTFIHTQLTANKTYYYRVKALGNGVNFVDSDFSTDTATTLSTKPIGLAPPPIDAVAVSSSEIDIYTDSVQFASGKILQYLDVNEWVTLDTLDNDVVVYQHTPLTGNKKFVYRIQSYSTDTLYLPSIYTLDSATTFADDTLVAQTLSTPTINAVTTGTTQIDVELDSTGHAQSIVLERSINNSTWNIVGTYAPSFITVSDTGLIPSTKYYYRAYFTGDNELYLNSLYGYDSSVTNAVPQLAAPSPLVASATTSKSNTVSITNVANETGYQYQYSTNKTTWTTFKTSAANVVSAVHSNLTPSTKYYYRAKATSSNSSYTASPYSNIDSATTLAGTSTLSTPSIDATGRDSTSVLITWTNIANENSYALERTDDGILWTIIANPTVNVSTYTDAALSPSTIYTYRIHAVGNGTTFLNSGYSTDTALTKGNIYITRFGLLPDPGTSGQTQTSLALKFSDSLSQCIVRSIWIADANVIRQVDTYLATEKELTLNISSHPNDTSKNFISNIERPKYVFQVDTLFRRHLLNKNDTLIVISNEENNLKEYHKGDTTHTGTTLSETNTARRYYYNEARVIDSIAKALGPLQFRTAFGGITGKGAMWFTWRNLMDSGYIVQANEFAYAMFTAAERKNLATWDKTGVYVTTITMMKQLFVLYRSDHSVNYMNVHIVMPVNGIDSTHINGNCIAYIMRTLQNITGKPVICNELGSKSVSPLIMAELYRYCAIYKMPYSIGYSGTAQTTTPTNAGLDVNWLTADYSQLNAVGINVLTELLKLINFSDL